VGKTKRDKRTKIMAVADTGRLPVAVCAESATPHEVTLVQVSEIRQKAPPSFQRHRAMIQEEPIRADK